MYRAKGGFEWRQTASILAMIVNVNRDPKKSAPATEEDFNLFADRNTKQVVSSRKCTAKDVANAFLKDK